MPRVRAVWGLVRLTARLERRRTIITLLPVFPLGLGVIALSGRQMINGWGDTNLVPAAVAGAAGAVMTVGLYWQITTGNLRLSEITGLAIDELLIDGVTSHPSVDLFDDPKMLDRMELLRVGKQPITAVIALVRDLFGVVTSLLVSTLLLVAADPRLALLPLCTLPLIVVYYRAEAITDAAERRLAERRREALHLFDVATSPGEAKELRVLGLQDVVRDRYAATWAELDKGLTGAAVRASLLRLAGWTLFAVVAGFALLHVVGDPSRAALSGGNVFLLVTATMQLAFVVGGAAQTIGQARRSLTMAGHLAAVTGTVGEASVASGEVPARLAAGMELRSVSFRYPGAAVDALDGVDLSLPAGSSIAIVGENGAGKSTLVKLLCGLYQPTGGSITVDGIGLDALAPGGWFDRLAVVCQDFARFELVIRECVGVGDLPTLDDRIAVAAALGRAGADEVVAGLADGLDTQLGMRFGGTDLSGGQWQRLAVARGMMRRSPLLLVLDEPTVALDAITEQRLLERCIADARELAAVNGTIVVYVSHRYSTVRLADRIVVLDGGRVAEAGSHDELLAAGGRYATAYRRQAATYR